MDVFFFHNFFLQHTKRRHLQKYEKKKIRPLLTTYCTNAKLLTIQYLRFLQIRHCILFTTLTLLTIQYLRYLQYDTYTSYNTIFVLLTVKNIFFNLQYVYNFVVLVQYTGVYI